ALIDLALGERAQRFMVEDVDRLLEALNGLPAPFASRVSFLPISQRPASTANATEPATPAEPPIPAHPGVVDRADRLVTCDDPRLSDLPVRLLDHTLLVQDLATAREVAAGAPGYR